MSHFPDPDIIGGWRREGDHGHGSPQHAGDDPDRHGGQGGSTRSARAHHIAGNSCVVLLMFYYVLSSCNQSTVLAIIPTSVEFNFVKKLS